MLWVQFHCLEYCLLLLGQGELLSLFSLPVPQLHAASGVEQSSRLETVFGDTGITNHIPSLDEL